MLYGRPLGFPELDRNLSPKYIGPNWIFISSIGYLVATCMQSFSVQIGLGIGGWWYFAAVAIGYVVYGTKLRKTTYHFIDVILMVAMIAAWGATFPVTIDGTMNPRELQVQLYLPFYINAPLAFMAGATSLFQMPFTQRYIQETCDQSRWSSVEVTRASHFTTWCFALSFTLSTLLYLQPYMRGQANSWGGKYSDGTWSVHPTPLLCRITLPALFFVISALLTRFWYHLWWFRPAWMFEGESNNLLHGEELVAADAKEVEQQKGQKGAARRFLGQNWILFSVFGLLAATGWQISDIRIGLGIGWIFTLVSIILGYLAWKFELRKNRVFSIEIVFFIVCLAPWCATFPWESSAVYSTEEVNAFVFERNGTSGGGIGRMTTVNATVSAGGPSDNEWTIQNNLNFIVFPPIAVFALASCLLIYPFTMQHIRESVPQHHWNQPELRRAALWTTCYWVTAAVISTVFYLIPYMAGSQNRTSGRYGNYARGNDGSMAVIFRIVVPMCLCSWSAIATRFWWWRPIGSGTPPHWVMDDKALGMIDSAAGAIVAARAGSGLDPAAQQGLAQGFNPDGTPIREYLVNTEIFGSNYQLLLIFGLIYAAAWQTRNMLMGCGVAAFFYLGSMFYGCMAWRAGLRKVAMYWQEAVMAAIFLILWAISYPAPTSATKENQSGGYANNPNAIVIQNYFPFIVNAILSALSLGSVLFQRPFTFQQVLETVVQPGWVKPELLPAAYYTAIAWFVAHTLSVFSYLIVFQAKIQGHTNGQYNSGGTGKDNAFVMVFRIVVPCILYLLAALFTRFWYLLMRPPWSIRQIKAPDPLAPPEEVNPETPMEEPKEGVEPLPIQEPDWDLYRQQYASYLEQLALYQQQVMMLQQGQALPPPPPEPMKPQQAAGIPRYALLPPPPPPSGPLTWREGLLGWGDEAHWQQKVAAEAWRQHLQQPMAKFMESNHIFISTAGYIVAFGMQATDVRTGSGVATLIYASSIGLSLMLGQAGVRKVWIYFMEVALFVVFLFLWAFTYPDGPNSTPSSREINLQTFYPFIVNAVMAGVALLSSLMQYPLTVQYIRSMVPYAAWRHPKIISVAQVTTWVWILAFTASCLLYIIPYSKGLQQHIPGAYDVRGGDQSSANALAVIFRIVVPICLVTLSALFTRIYPSLVLEQAAAASERFNHVTGGASSGPFTPQDDLRLVDNPLSMGASRLYPPSSLRGLPSLPPTSYIRANYNASSPPPSIIPSWQQQLSLGISGYNGVLTNSRKDQDWTNIMLQQQEEQKKLAAQKAVHHSQPSAAPPPPSPPSNPAADPPGASPSITQLQQKQQQIQQQQLAVQQLQQQLAGLQAQARDVRR